MLDVDGLTLRLADAPLFDGVSFRLSRGQRVALAGRNGQGKSTLMKAIMGQAGYEGGTIVRAKGSTVGYLPQDIHTGDSSRTAIEELLAGAGDVRRLEAEVLCLAERMAERPEDEALLAAYGRAHTAFEAAGGYGLEAQARTVLAGLGFTQERMDAPVTTLSGGWRMRVHLAKLLLAPPDLMMLDEPTNHLDIESREWLLGFLSRHDGALLITSHDRYFLDHLVARVLELERGQLTVYHGTYTVYEQKRAERIDRLKQAHARQQRELKRQQDFIERNRANASTASNVQSRIKQVAKIERVALPPEPPNVKLRFPEPPSSGQIAFRLHGVAKRYGAVEVFRGLDLELPAGERLAVVGVNGAGKTTLLKLLASKAEPSEGALELGHNVQMQYFSQYEDDLPGGEYDLLQAMEEAAPPDCAVDRRTILGCFLFDGDNAYKRVSVLSGGERARLKLARMLLKPSNLLVLDEPTNHLDLHSKDVLLSALQAFGGSTVFVSHDREFLAALATSVLEIADGRARFFPCDYEQYRWRIEREKAERSAAAAAERAKLATSAAAPAARPSGGGGRRAKGQGKPKAKGGDSAARREQRREMRHLERRVEELQRDLEKKEARLGELEALMSEAGFFDAPERSAPVVAEHKALQMEIGATYEAFEASLGRLEAAQVALE